MSLDQVFRNLARDLPRQVSGKAVTVRKVSRDLDPVDPGGGTYIETTTDYPTTASPPAPYSQGYIDGQLVQAGDMQVIVPALDVTEAPETGWLVIMDGDEWSVVSVEWLWSGEQVAAYQLQVRR